MSNITITNTVVEVHRVRRALLTLARSNLLLEDRGAHHLPDSYIPNISWVLPTVLVGGIRRNLNTLYANTPKKEDFLPKIIEPLIEKVIALYRGLLDVFIVHLGRLPTQQQSNHLVVKWMSLAAEDRLEEWFKYHSCWIFSKVHSQDILINEMPIRPEWMPEHEADGFILGGWFWRKIRKFIFQGPSPKVTAFLYALTNVKRAGLAISAKKQEEALISHMKNMKGAEFKPKNIVVPMIMPCNITGEEEVFELPISAGELAKHVEGRMVDLMRKIYTRKEGERAKWRCPSVSACWEASKKMGGSHLLYERPFATWSLEFIGFATYRTKVTPVYVPYHPDDLLSVAWEIFDTRPEDMPIKAEVHKVLEPFKARIITAGEGNIYQLGRCLQRKIHRNLLRFDEMFHLIGNPASPEFVTQIYKDSVLCKGPRRHEEMTAFCAGDYKAATDGMLPRISQAFVEEYSKLAFLSRKEESVLRMCMGKHLLKYSIPVPEDLRIDYLQALEYDVPSEDREFTLLQTHGQLMGSPISFPILCLANAAINWVAADLYEGQLMSFENWKERHRPIFNGDDTSFLSNEIHYEIWKIVAASIGLNPSLGKSYFSKDFVMINSEIFWMNQSTCAADVELKKVTGCMRLGVLNPGLVKGQAKVLDDSRKPKIAIGEYHEELISMGAQLARAKRDLSLRSEQIDAIFRSHVMEKLKMSPRSWCLPIALGGLGLSFGSVNYSQSKLAALCMMDVDYLSVVASYERTSPCYAIQAQHSVREIYDQLGYELTNYIYHENEKGEKETMCGSELLNETSEEEGLDLSAYYIGGRPETHGKNSFSSLLKEVRTFPWVNELSKEKLEKLKQAFVIRAPSHKGMKMC